MIVLDASAAVCALLRLEPHHPWASTQLRDHAGDVHAPHLLDIEIAGVLRRLRLRGSLPATRAAAALVDAADLPVRRYAHRLVLTRVGELFAQLSAYDAAYVALAELLDAPLITLDERLARSHGHRARIVTPATT